MINIIVAMAKHHVIGKDNALIWHLPNDLQFFKKMTTNHVIIMGRNTFESLPFLLPHREHWVLTKQNGIIVDHEKVRIFHSVEDVIEAARKLDTDVYIIGGAMIYQACMPYADRLYITEIDHEFEGDACFPAIDTDIFEKVSTTEGVVDEKNIYPHTFVTYERKAR